MQGGLLSDYPVRRPYLSELEYFKNNPHVAGMAAEDNSVILNPFSSLLPDEQKAVILNETARLYMRNNEMAPDFPVTQEQQGLLGNYGSPTDIRSTIAARTLSGDPSIAPTQAQKQFSDLLRMRMFGK